MVSLEALEELYERLLKDEDTKDVEIEMQDGNLFAHSCMLCASSDAMRGMLRHGNVAHSAQKQLCWREHTIEVGRFLLRLLYTGTVAEEEWEGGGVPETAVAVECAGGASAGGAAAAGISRQTPLRLLLGALSIAKVYQVPHLIHVLTEALKVRVDDESFDEICAGAIRMDVTALRMHCLRYAERCDAFDICEGARVRALRHITVQNADVPKESLGIVNSNNVIEWDDTGSIGYGTDVDLVKHMVELVSVPRTNRIREMYVSNELSPEVTFELAALWGPSETSRSSRRRTL